MMAAGVFPLRRGLVAPRPVMTKTGDTDNTGGGRDVISRMMPVVMFTDEMLWALSVLLQPPAAVADSGQPP